MDAAKQLAILGGVASSHGDSPAPMPGFNAWQIAQNDAEIAAHLDAGRAVPSALLKRRDELRKSLDGAANLVAPMFQILAATRVNELRKLIEAGDGGAAVEAMARCATHGLIAPGWLAAAFVTRYQRVAVGEAKSWDDPSVFGPAVPPGTNVAGVRAAQQKAPAAHEKALELLSEDPYRPIDKGFYEAVGEAIGTGATQAEKLIAQYVESGHGTWPAPSEIKPFLQAAGGDLTAAWMQLREQQMQARWLASGCTLAHYEETYGDPEPHGLGPSNRPQYQ